MNIIERLQAHLPSVEPLPSVVDGEIRRQARALASVSLLVIVFLILKFTSEITLHALVFQQGYVLANVGLVIAFSLIIVLARRGHIRAGLFIGMAGASLIIAYIASWYPADDGLRYLYFLAALTLFGMLFTIHWPLLPLVIFQGLLLAAAPLYITNTDVIDLIYGPLDFYIIVVTLNAIVLRHRDQLEAQRIAQISQSEFRYRQLVESISDIVIVSTPDGQMLSINRAGISFYGRKLSNQGPVSLRQHIHPDDLPLSDRLDRELERTGRLNNYEVRIRNASGQYRWLECSTTLTYQANKPPTLTTVCRDVTERKLEQERQLNREARFRFITEQIADYAYTLTINQVTGDVTHEMIAGSKLPLSGYADEELPNIDTFYAPAFRAAAYDEWFRVLRGEPISLESQVLRKNGEPIWIVTYAFPVREGDLLSIYVLVQDISVRKAEEARQLMAAVERERLATANQIVRAISHDFRTWLATIETSRYLIGRFTQGEAAQEQISSKLNTIRLAVIHLTGQIDNLRSFTALTHLNLVPCSVAPIAEALWHEWTRRAHDKQLSFDIAIESPDLTILAEADELSRAVSQLIANAISNTPPGGQIRLEVASEPGSVLMRVHDTGVGISPEHLAYIFDPFYRPDSARGTDRGGVGIGLSIARMIAEAFGGTLDVVSTAGTGSIFTLRFPAIAPHSATQMIGSHETRLE